MSLVYVCSPLRGYVRDGVTHTMDDNIAAAEEYCRQVAILGRFPLAPHLLLTRFLNDEIESERQLGLSLGLDVLEKCDAVWVFGTYLSSGMRGEIRRALDLGIPLSWWQEGNPWAGNVNRAVELPAALKRAEAMG